MKTKIFLATVLALGMAMFASVSAWGDPSAYYNQCLDERIANCERKASYETCSGTQLRECAKEAKDEAAFLKANRDRLVAEMEAEGLKPVDHKVNYRLIKAFQEAAQ